MPCRFVRIILSTAHGCKPAMFGLLCKQCLLRMDIKIDCFTRSRLMNQLVSIMLGLNAGKTFQKDVSARRFVVIGWCSTN